MLRLRLLLRLLCRLRGGRANDVVVADVAALAAEALHATEVAVPVEVGVRRAAARRAGDLADESVDVALLVHSVVDVVRLVVIVVDVVVVAARELDSSLLFHDVCVLLVMVQKVLLFSESANIASAFCASALSVDVARLFFSECLTRMYFLSYMLPFDGSLLTCVFIKLFVRPLPLGSHIRFR